ncbi:MAG: 50S ribosomal protein L13 [Candidatus Heimdallarchaeaceae archaeon]
MSKEMKLKNTKRSLTTINIDADGAILGRMCSEVAKYLLEGYSVNIVNCEKAIISGKRQSHTLSNPRRGPFHSKRPDRVVRRTVRGMLPWKKSKGKTAYHKLLTYIGIPEKLKDSEIVKPKFADSSKLKCNKITVGELCKGFGWS